MATIRTTISEDLVVFAAEGNLSAAEIIEAIRINYPTRVTKHVLWDISQASITDIRSSGFKEIAIMARKYSAEGRRGRTAYVSSDDLSFGLLRMYTVYAENEGVPAEYEVFHDRAEAMKWIFGGAMPA